MFSTEKLNAHNMILYPPLSDLINLRLGFFASMGACRDLAPGKTYPVYYAKLEQRPLGSEEVAERWDKSSGLWVPCDPEWERDCADYYRGINEGA